jgi:hypothetical protein
MSKPRSAYFQSDDGSLKEDNPLAQWSNLMKEALSASGREHPSEQLLRQRLEKAGFVDVQAFTLPVPVGPWAKDKYVCPPEFNSKLVKAGNTHSGAQIGVSRSWASCCSCMPNRASILMVCMLSNEFNASHAVVADCFRNARIYQNPGHGSQRGG